MEKFLRKEKEPEFFSKRLSGYITPEGVVYLTDSHKLLVKRFLDLVVSVFFLLFIMSWAFPIIALMIRFDSKGPILFKQLRHGKGNRTFWCYKFRTMRLNTESDLLQASRDDLRVTRVGRFLRKSSIDEIPQLVNVLLGEMSLIGPRPHAVPMNHLFSNEIDNYMFRHAVKPGITGLAQSKGFRGEVLDYYDIYGRVKLDHFYIRKWCLVLDFKIVFWTLLTLLFKNGKAY